LKFLKEVDRRSGYRTRQMLVSPIVRGNELQGVLQLVNRPAGGSFGRLEQEGVQRLCETLSAAIRQRTSPPSRAGLLTSRFHGLVADGIVTADELSQCVQNARA
jgi:hypothetical protein